MINEPLISVIIPVYNVEKYLERCLQSVLCQTYRKLEIILIDDGSTDGSSALLDAYAAKDSRIVVYHKANGGLSDARNYGIESANGEYLTFIDSDDDVTADYIEYLIKLLEDNKCAMSLCTHNVIFENGKVNGKGTGGQEVLKAERCLERMLYHDVVDTSAWGKLYNKKLFADIRFPKGKLFEDIGTTYKFFIASKKIACGYENKYNYYIRKNSIVTSGFNANKLDLLTMTDKMVADVNVKYPVLKHATLRRSVYARFSTLNQMLDIDNMAVQKREMINYIKNNAWKVFLNPKTPKRDKFAIIAIYFGFSVYKFSWFLFTKNDGKSLL